MNLSDEELVELVYDHLCENQPDAVASLSDAEIQRRAKIGVARARGHGLDTEGAIAAFVSLMFLVAPNFDQNPAIAAVLRDSKSKADDRMKKLFERTREEDWEAAAAASDPSVWGTS